MKLNLFTHTKGFFLALKRSFAKGGHDSSSKFEGVQPGEKSASRSRSIIFPWVIPVFLLAVLTVGCEKKDNPIPVNDISTGFLVTGDMKDNKLPVNGVATFRLNVVGYDGNLDDLQYRWTLTEGRGEFWDGTNALPNPLIAGRTINCIGRTEGDEGIKVEILDAEGNLLAERSTDFEITGFLDPPTGQGCFDQPKIIYHYEIDTYVMNYDGTDRVSIYNSGNLPDVAISPNGEWIAYQKYFNKDIDGDPVEGYNIVLRRCDSFEEILIPISGLPSFNVGDAQPFFSPDSKTLYFMRYNTNQGVDCQDENDYWCYIKYRDLAAYDIESGEWRFLTDHWQSETYVYDFVVSPVTGEIYYFHVQTDEWRLRILNPGTGDVRDFNSQDIRGIEPDISPDGQDIIFVGGTSEEYGIYRLELVDGAQPLLLYQFDPQYTGFGRPHYYAGGTRIMMAGYQDKNNSNLWSIDANGNDLQQVTDTPGDELMIGVLH